MASPCRRVSACCKVTCSLEEQEKVRSSMKRFKVNFFSCLVAAVLIPLLLTTAVAQAQAASWTVVKSPNPLAGGNQLNGVASVSANDVWAVGVALTLHWNG